jgi:hypothetical protein
MKTLTQLKKDLQIGDKIVLVEAPTMPNHRSLNIERYIVKKQGNGVYLSQQKSDKKGSFLEFPNAKLVEYEENEVRVYDPQKRPLTEEEQRIWNNRPSVREENEEQRNMDLLAGTSLMYWANKGYFNKMGMGHFNDSTSRFTFHSHDMTMTDKQLKGELVLRYEIIKSTN